MSNLTRNKILSFFIVLTVLFTSLSFISQETPIFWLMISLTILSGICLSIVIKDMIQTKHSLLRNYPLIGRFRWVFEHERSKIQQYFIEHDTNGTPYNREKRSDIYQKSKMDVNTTPFGTQLDVYEKGYEFIKHYLYPKDLNDVKEPRVYIGSKFCTQPYNASIFNVSAMSYGALSDAAVKAINGGAKIDRFFQNTGEGGLSDELKEASKLFNSARTKVEFDAPKDQVLENLDENNQPLADLVKASSEGAGPAKLKLTGFRSWETTETSVKSFEFDSLEIESDTQTISKFVEQLKDKMQGE